MADATPPPPPGRIARARGAPATPGQRSQESQAGPIACAIRERPAGACEAPGASGSRRQASAGVWAAPAFRSGDGELSTGSHGDRGPRRQIGGPMQQLPGTHVAGLDQVRPAEITGRVCCTGRQVVHAGDTFETESATPHGARAAARIRSHQATAPTDSRKCGLHKLSDFDAPRPARARGIAGSSHSRQGDRAHAHDSHRHGQAARAFVQNSAVV
jgi:hypothetical protein